MNEFADSTTKIEPIIESSWKNQLMEDFEAPYFLALKSFLTNEKKEGHVIFPPGNEIFAAFNYTPFDQTKVVILGQDPYHGAGQAHGLSFSVGNGIPTPPSLANIYKELKNDLDMAIPTHGNLTNWAQQGVLLLNSTLTVRKSQPGSHQGKGWETFTDKVISILSNHKEHLVFLLWGKYAQAKQSLIDNQKHLILTAPHPSPFSAYTGFFHCKHFSRTNHYLQSHGIKAVDWTL